MGVLGHELLGAPKVLGPLLSSGLPDDVIWLHHFSWHVGSIAVLAMVYMFVQAAKNPGQTNLARIATMMSLAFSAMGIVLAVFGNSALWTTPAPWAWSLVSVFGLLGIVAARQNAPSGKDM